MEIIAFSGARGVGKTTTARIIADILYNVKDVYILSFAEYLREVIGEWYGEDIAILSTMRDKKDVPLKYLNISYTENLFSIDTNLTPRQLLINTGTYMRSLNEDIFCIELKNRIDKIVLEKKDSLIVIDDLRFDNELKWLKSLETKNWAITLERIDKELGTENIEDYITYDKSDLCFHMYTYDSPFTNGMCIEDIKFLVQDLLDIKLGGI